MRMILLSGGSGKRLWPLSNEARSKQFLKVISNSHGEPQSMVQRVWSQLESAGFCQNAYITTGKAQVDIIQNQLGADVRLIVEPERRDTFPAIALACSFLFTCEGIKCDEVIAVLPVDPFVDNRYFDTVKELETELISSNKKLALIGVVPTYPSEKYGYIIPDNVQSICKVIDVDHFREKPDEKLACELIGKNALWNCGVFAFRLGFVLDTINDLGLSVLYDNLRKDYALLPKVSFDYQVVEKTKEIIALRYDGSWKDLGTWNTLTEEMFGHVIGKGVISEDSNNTHLINELDIPIAVLGISNSIVAASPDGILVAEKKATPRLKELISSFGGRPMFEERRWGWYRVLDHTKFPQGREVLTKRIGIKAGKSLSYQMHYFRSEIWTVVSGTGEFALDGTIYPVKAGDVLQIKNQAKHGVRAISDLEIIEVQMGRELIEEDIVRLYMTWDEIEDHCDRHLVVEMTPVPERV